MFPCLNISVFRATESKKKRELALMAKQCGGSIDTVRDRFNCSTQGHPSGMPSRRRERNDDSELGPLVENEPPVADPANAVVLQLAFYTKRAHLAENNRASNFNEVP